MRLNLRHCDSERNGQSYPAERVEKIEQGWRVLFHVRVSAPVQLYLDESLPPDHLASVDKPSPLFAIR